MRGVSLTHHPPAGKDEPDLGSGNTETGKRSTTGKRYPPTRLRVGLAPVKQAGWPAFLLKTGPQSNPTGRDSR